MAGCGYERCGFSRRFGLLAGFLLLLGGFLTLLVIALVWWQEPRRLVGISIRDLAIPGASTVIGGVLFGYFGALRLSFHKRLALDAFQLNSPRPAPPHSVPSLVC